MLTINSAFDCYGDPDDDCMGAAPLQLYGRFNSNGTEIEASTYADTPAGLVGQGVSLPLWNTVGLSVFVMESDEDSVDDQLMVDTYYITTQILHGGSVADEWMENGSYFAIELSLTAQ